MTERKTPWQSELSGKLWRPGLQAAWHRILKGMQENQGRGWPWASHVPSPSLSFLPSKMGIMTQDLPPLQPVVRIQLIPAKVTLETGPVTGQRLREERMAGGRSYRECNLTWGVSADIDQAGFQAWGRDTDKGEGPTGWGFRHQPLSERSQGAPTGLVLRLHISLGRNPKGNDVWLCLPARGLPPGQAGPWLPLGVRGEVVDELPADLV